MASKKLPPFSPNEVSNQLVRAASFSISVGDARELCAYLGPKNSLSSIVKKSVVTKTERTLSNLLVSELILDKRTKPTHLRKEIDDLSIRAKNLLDQIENMSVTTRGSLQTNGFSEGIFLSPSINSDTGAEGVINLGAEHVLMVSLRQLLTACESAKASLSGSSLGRPAKKSARNAAAILEREFDRNHQWAKTSSAAYDKRRGTDEKTIKRMKKQFLAHAFGLIGHRSPTL